MAFTYPICYGSMAGHWNFCPSCGLHVQSYKEKVELKPGTIGEYNMSKPSQILQDFQACMRQVELQIGVEAAQKGYGGDQEDKAEVLDFVAKKCPSHAEGEIIYKVLRWRSKKDPKDLIKIMAWAFLIWWRDQASSK